MTEFESTKWENMLKFFIYLVTVNFPYIACYVSISAVATPFRRQDLDVFSYFECNWNLLRRKANKFSRAHLWKRENGIPESQVRDSDHHCPWQSQSHRCTNLNLNLKVTNYTLTVCKKNQRRQLSVIIKSCIFPEILIEYSNSCKYWDFVTVCIL